MQALSFEVHVWKNLTEIKLKRVLKDWSEYDHSDSDAFVICVLTHGTRRTIQCTDGAMDKDELSDYFTGENCVELLQKPKLFFLQTCADHRKEKSACSNDRTDRDTRIKVPTHQDMLTYHSTIPGSYSWEEDASKGSTFFVLEVVMIAIT